MNKLFLFLTLVLLGGHVLADTYTYGTNTPDCDTKGKFCTNKNLGGTCYELCGNGGHSVAGLSSFQLYDSSYVWYIYYANKTVSNLYWAFRGGNDSTGYTADLANFPSMNDADTLITASPASGNPAVTLYENSNFQGRSAYFEIGNYANMNIPWVGEGTIPGNSLSSVAIFGDNTYFAYYKNTGYGSNPLYAYSTSQAQVVDNDQCNSFIIDNYGTL